MMYSMVSGTENAIPVMKMDTILLCQNTLGNVVRSKLIQSKGFETLGLVNKKSAYFFILICVCVYIFFGYMLQNEKGIKKQSLFFFFRYIYVFFFFFEEAEIYLRGSFVFQELNPYFMREYCL